MNINMINLLVENDAHLYCLPPHTTNILRKLKAYFSHLTDMVKIASLGMTNHIHISKKNFSAIFKEAFDNALVVSKGFRKCGIMPFNSDAIGKNRCQVMKEMRFCLKLSQSILLLKQMPQKHLLNLHQPWNLSFLTQVYLVGRFPPLLLLFQHPLICDV